MFGCCGVAGFWGIGAPGSIGILIFILPVVLILGMILWMGYRMVRQFSGNARYDKAREDEDVQGESPAVILGVRYARGEISREQYFRMVNDLQGKRGVE